MIRLNMLNLTYFRARMRSMTRLQIAAVIFSGFLIGYLILPRFLSTPSLPSSNSSPFGASHKHSHSHLPSLKKVREPAIRFTEDGQGFIIEGKKKLIMSGAIHYFRVVPAYWEDRLMKLKAAGLNTVETYVPWNLHEPIPDTYDFTGILDIREFILTAQNLGLHVIVRPGPFICSEWELGGLPAWLLHDPDMELRSLYPHFMEALQDYFRKLFEILTPLQYSYGGPIIALQIENEFALRSSSERESLNYMKTLYTLMHELGATELLFTSDDQNHLERSLRRRPAEDVLMTVNFMVERDGIKKLTLLQPHKPRMVMEFWTGWFEHWNEDMIERDQTVEQLSETTTSFIQRGVSFNFYMFHGGTNFGFMNGAIWGHGTNTTVYLPTITSYDYRAPLSESGDITGKYKAIREVLSQLAPESLPVSPLPPIPKDLPKLYYGDVELTLYIPLISTMQYIPDPYLSNMPIPMEYLPVNEGWGQGYGYVLYRTLIPANARKITVNGLRDYGVAMVDFNPVKKLAYFERQSFLLPKTEDKGTGQLVLDILVENAGHVNVGEPLEVRKGISGDILVDGVTQTDWKIYSFEFKPSYVENIESGGMWLRTPAPFSVGPALYKTTFNVHGKPCDTFADMTGWGKGILIINGANLGRYWSAGPQQTLYVPAPILRTGINKVMIFEFHQPRIPQSITFRSQPILSPDPPKL